MRRLGSVRSRKVSTQSLQSTTSADDQVLSTFVNFDDAAGTATAAPDTPCDEGQDTQTDQRETGDELDYCRNLPWIKVPSYVFDLKKVRAFPILNSTTLDTFFVLSLSTLS